MCSRLRVLKELWAAHECTRRLTNRSRRMGEQNMPIPRKVGANARIAKTGGRSYEVQRGMVLVQAVVHGDTVEGRDVRMAGRNDTAACRDGVVAGPARQVERSVSSVDAHRYIVVGRDERVRGHE